MHLNFIVGQTEKYSSWLMESMSEPVGTGTASSSRCLSRELSVRGSGSELDKSDLSSESDDEATIEKEEAAPSEVSNLCIVFRSRLRLHYLKCLKQDSSCFLLLHCGHINHYLRQGTLLVTAVQLQERT